MEFRRRCEMLITHCHALLSILLLNRLKKLLYGVLSLVFFHKSVSLVFTISAPHFALMLLCT